MPRLPLPLYPLHALLWLAGSLPLRAAARLGSVLGRLPLWLRTREARITEDNIARCFPDLDPAGRARLVRLALQETARTLLETLRLWTRSPAQTLGWVREVDGEALLAAAEAAGRGVIVAAPHLGNWELLSRYLEARGRLAIVYRVPQVAALEPLLRHGRGGDDVLQLRAEPASVRRMLRHLRDGGTLGLLPDQRPKSGEGQWAPFFGQPALTMTLLPRLVRRSGCAVLFGFAERLPDAAGFRIRFLPAPAGIDADDLGVATAALNAGIEACVRLAPLQYQWTYRRFPRQPPPGHQTAPPTSGQP
jgi:Kdo2-lipid IVA lauroyltransferase/acyltransferase